MQFRILQIIFRISGLAIMIWSIYYGLTASQQFGKGSWLHLPSFILVNGCLLGYLLTSFQAKTLIDTVYLVFFRSPSAVEQANARMRERLQELTDIYYSQQTFPQVSTHAPKVWLKIVSWLQAKIPVGDIFGLVRRHASHEASGIQAVSTLLGNAASLAPSIGMFGTVIGLVQLLSNLDDMASLGPNMAMALLTTLYGIFLNVLIFSPLVARVNCLKEALERTYQDAQNWLEIIESRKPSFYLEQEKVKLTPGKIHARDVAHA